MPRSCAALLSLKLWLQSIRNLSFHPKPSWDSEGCRGKQQTPLSEEPTLAKLSEACRAGLSQAGLVWSGRKLGVLGPEQLRTGWTLWEMSGIGPGAPAGAAQGAGIVLVMEMS